MSHELGSGELAGLLEVEEILASPRTVARAQEAFRGLATRCRPATTEIGSYLMWNDQAA